MDFKSFIREMPGKNRCDLSLVFRDGKRFVNVIEQLAAPFAGQHITHVAGVDALGFALAGAVAVKLEAGFVAIRKAEKAAWATRSVAFIDYTGCQKSLELVVDALDDHCRVLIVDDWSETGTQLAAVAELCAGSGATVAGAAVLHADERARGLLASKIPFLHSVF